MSDKMRVMDPYWMQACSRNNVVNIACIYQRLKHVFCVSFLGKDRCVMRLGIRV